MADILGVSTSDMARHRRKMKRRIAASIITAMAETDADYEFIAKRLGEKPETTKGWIVGLIDGESKCMDEASDLLLAMGGEFIFKLEPYREPIRPEADEPAVS